MLSVSELTTFYGPSQALFGVSLEVGRAEVVTLLGRNGMGKTTTLQSIMGTVSAHSGEGSFQGTQILHEPAYKIARMGTSIVPEGRQIFPNLTVRENLIATARSRPGAKALWDLERVLEMFPILQSRLDFMGNLLSGGEQQMIAIGRALMTNPQLLLLDDATEGLAPLVRTEIWQCIATLKKAGLSILIVDKNLKDLLQIADRNYVLEKGRVIWSGTSTQLAGDHALQQRYLGV